MTRKDLENLKSEWLCDPCWDIYDTEGFEEYKDELKKFQEEQETVWKQKQEEREKWIDVEARNLGIEGLYRKILELQDIVNDIPRSVFRQ